MTTLAALPLDPDQLSILDLVTDIATPLGKLHALDFQAACVADGRANGGFVHPSRVSAILHARFGEVNPRQLSAQWAGACSRNGFLDKTDIRVPIDGKHSRGNGNKEVALRRLRP